MAQQEATNTFTDGLVMDFHPLATPNKVLTNCLNGTLLTFNGNELMLLNDMGNGKVETAYLPSGYVPVGMTELGGIIYVASVNPDNNKCQIGCFPSPERNFSSEDLGITLSFSFENLLLPDILNPSISIRINKNSIEEGKLYYTLEIDEIGKEILKEYEPEYEPEYDPK